jgi:hypothetical protein
MFPFGDEWRTLTDPKGAPSGRQLLRLHHLGLLELRDTPGEPITKLDAARAIDQAESDS